METEAKTHLQLIQQYLMDIQNQTFENKVLNLILNLFEGQDNFEKELTTLQNKLNEIIEQINKKEEIEEVK